MVTVYLYTTIGPFLLCIGSVGSIMGCIVFSQKSMRKNPSSIYFIAYNVANLLSIYYVLLLGILAYYNIDPSYYNVPYCKFYYFVRQTCVYLAPYYLVLSSIDRTLSTSSNATMRQRSTHRLAYKVTLLQ